MNNEHKIFAIIVTYNGMKWVDRCLGSLRQSTVGITPIVIDNGSTDSTRSYLPEHFPEAVWMPQERNLGFGAANNLGMRYALANGADYVLLLNQDAWIEPHTLELLLRESDGQPLLSPLHLNGAGTRLDYFFRTSLRNTKNELYDDLLLDCVQPHYESTEICAACWLMPRALLEQVGGFNPLFFHYSEDNNYYHRMVYHKVKTLLVPAAKVYHDRGMYGNAQAFNRKRLHRDFVLALTDINHSLLHNFAKLFALIYTCYKRDLPRHAYKPGAWLLEFCTIWGNLPRIIASRQAEKKTGLTWL